MVWKVIPDGSYTENKNLFFLIGCNLKEKGAFKYLWLFLISVQTKTVISKAKKIN